MLIWDTHPIPKKLVLFWSNWAVFGRQCHFTPRNRLLIDHSGMADAISVQRNEGKCQKRSCPSSPNSNARWGRGGGGGEALFTSSIGSRHTLLLEISSRYWGVRLNSFFCRSYPWENVAKEHSILVRIFGLEHHFVFNFIGTPCTSIYYTNYTK